MGFFSWKTQDTNKSMQQKWGGREGGDSTIIISKKFEPHHNFKQSKRLLTSTIVHSFIFVLEQ